MCIFLDYRCSNSKDRASQVVICYVMTDLKIYISVYSITYSTLIHLVQQVTGPRITPVKSKLDQSKVQWSKWFGPRITLIPSIVVTNWAI